MSKKQTKKEFTPEEIKIIQGVIDQKEPGNYIIPWIFRKIPIKYKGAIEQFHNLFKEAVDNGLFNHIYARGIKLHRRAAYHISFSENIDKIKQWITVSKVEREEFKEAIKKFVGKNWDLFTDEELEYIQYHIDQATPGEQTLLSIFGFEKWEKIKNKCFYGMKFKDAVYHGYLKNIDFPEVSKKDDKNHRVYEVFSSDSNKSRPEIERKWYPEGEVKKEIIVAPTSEKVAPKEQVLPASNKPPKNRYFFTKKEIPEVQKIIIKKEGGHYPLSDIFSGTSFIDECDLDILEKRLSKALEKNQLTDIFDGGEGLYLIFHPGAK